MIADSGSEDIRSQALDLRTCHSLQCPEGTCGVRPNPRLGCRGLQRDPGRRGTIHGTRHIHAADRTIPDHPGRPPWQTTLADHPGRPHRISDGCMHARACFMLVRVGGYTPHEYRDFATYGYCMPAGSYAGLKIRPTEYCKTKNVSTCRKPFYIFICTRHCDIYLCKPHI